MKKSVEPIPEDFVANQGKVPGDRTEVHFREMTHREIVCGHHRCKKAAIVFRVDEVKSINVQTGERGEARYHVQGSCSRHRSRTDEPYDNLDDLFRSVAVQVVIGS